MNSSGSGFPRVSVIIPHWNGIEILSDCLDSLTKSTYPNLEIVVVDNASTDGSPEWVAENHPDVKLVRCDENHGYAGGCNRGAEVAKGEFLLFLNNDTVHEPGWIEPLVESMEVNETVAAVQPKILNYFERNKFDYAGGAGGALDILCFPFVRGRVFFELEEDEGQYDGAAEIFWASGTAFLVRKSVFEDSGGFDESFFAHQEEIDLQWRIHLMGYTIKAAPQSVVYHRNAATLPMESPRKKYLNHRNSLLMLLSNYNLPLTLYLFPIRFVLEFVAALYAVALFDFPHVLAVFKSLGWIVIHPRLIARRRRRVHLLRKLSDKEMMGKFY
ncbi:MAG: glycosyltransferase family 2 protein, partial [Candidatus Poseidoniia archaeon]|nr:glycosyltransferase family 2 protein [Candidatus Poseidoniia archaeon]